MANYTKLKVIWKNNLHNTYKENTIIGVGQEAVINFSEEGISNIYVNFEVNGEVYTDLVKINGNTINVPFKTDVLKVGTHKLEIVAYLKNGDVIPSPTFNYYVEDAIENPDDITAETHYPILIQLLEKIEEWNDNAVAQEEQRIINEELRESDEALRKSAEVQRAGAENERITNENERLTAEEQRIENEEDRIVSENERKNNENNRITSEELRCTKEDERIANESSRVNAEQTRVNAENSRITAEANRVTAENSRVQAENIRQGFYEGFNSDLEGLHAKDEEFSEQLAQVENNFDFRYVEEFGAIGDGETNDSEAFQLAIDFCSENKLKLYLKNKKYVLNDTLVLKSDLYIEGIFGCELFMPSSTTTKDVFTHSSSVRISNLTIKNIKLTSINDRNDVGGYGILSNIQGIILNNCENVLLQNIVTDCLSTSFKIVNPNTNNDYTDINNNVVIDNFKCLNNGTCCYITSTHNLTITNSVFEQSETVTSNRHCVYIKEDVDNINIDKCKIKNAKGGGIHLYVLPEDVAVGKIVNNINISNTSITNCAIGAYINYANNINISGSRIEGCDYIFSITSSSNIIADNCKLKPNISLFHYCSGADISIKNSKIDVNSITSQKVLDNGAGVDNSHITILATSIDNISKKLITTGANTQNSDIKFYGVDFNIVEYWGSGGFITINNTNTNTIFQSCKFENNSDTSFPYIYYSYYSDISKKSIFKDNIILGDVELIRPVEQENEGHGYVINNIL